MKKVAKNIRSIILMGIAVGLLYAIASRGTGTASALASPPNRKSLSNISLHDLQGQRWTLADHRGQVILLNFWATWCPPCRAETPGLVRLANSYKDRGLAVIGISMDDGGPDAVRGFVSEFRIPYPIAMPDGNFPLASAVQALPTTLLIDREGRVAKTYEGGASENTFRADIDALLAQSEGGR